VLEYQPIISLETGRIAGCEALVRWQHPTRGVVPPGDFVALAEESGAITEIGKWVLYEACRQAKVWQKELGPDNALCISVNFSATQFRDSNPARQVASVLAATHVEPSLIKVELTESLLMDNAEHRVDAVRQLKALGVRIVIDDFGTGYSSLRYLSSFPLDGLK